MSWLTRFGRTAAPRGAQWRWSYLTERARRLLSRFAPTGGAWRRCRSDPRDVADLRCGRSGSRTSRATGLPRCDSVHSVARGRASRSGGGQVTRRIGCLVRGAPPASWPARYAEPAALGESVPTRHPPRLINTSAGQDAGTDRAGVELCPSHPQRLVCEIPPEVLARGAPPSWVGVDLRGGAPATRLMCMSCSGGHAAELGPPPHCDPPSPRARRNAPSLAGGAHQSARRRGVLELTAEEEFRG